jgi:hypothetical protein
LRSVALLRDARRQHGPDPPRAEAAPGVPWRRPPRSHGVVRPVAEVSPPPCARDFIQFASGDTNVRVLEPVPTVLPSQGRDVDGTVRARPDQERDLTRVEPSRGDRTAKAVRAVVRDGDGGRIVGSASVGHLHERRGRHVQLVGRPWDRQEPHHARRRESRRPPTSPSGRARRAGAGPPWAVAGSRAPARTRSVLLSEDAGRCCRPPRRPAGPG